MGAGRMNEVMVVVAVVTEAREVFPVRGRKENPNPEAAKEI